MELFVFCIITMLKLRALVQRARGPARGELRLPGAAGAGRAAQRAGAAPGAGPARSKRYR